MDIVTRKAGKKWIAEVWGPVEENYFEAGKSTYPEEIYQEINDWCRNSFGYHARTAYHIFEFRKRSDLDWFLLRWQ